MTDGAPREVPPRRRGGRPTRRAFLQLRLFEEDRRGGSAYGHIMRIVVEGMTEDEMDAVAAWYASLPPERR